MDSIRLTFEHPIFGVGPGAFGFAAWDERKAATGVGGLAQVSHNTYTQISSETGIPGFLFFTATMLLCLKATLIDFRRAAPIDKTLSQAGRNMFIALVTLAVGIFFLSVGYTYMISVMFGLAASLSDIIERALAQNAATGTPVGAGVTGSRALPFDRSTIPAPKTPLSNRIRPTYLGSRGRNRV